MPEYNSWLAFCKVDCESQPDIASINGPYPIANVSCFHLVSENVQTHFSNWMFDKGSNVHPLSQRSRARSSCGFRQAGTPGIVLLD